MVKRASNSETACNSTNTDPHFGDEWQGLKLQFEEVSKSDDTGVSAARRVSRMYADAAGALRALIFSVEGLEGGVSPKFRLLPKPKVEADPNPKPDSDAEGDQGITVVVSGVGRLALEHVGHAGNEGASGTRKTHPSITLVTLLGAVTREVAAQPGDIFYLSMRPGVAGSADVVSSESAIERVETEQSTPDASSVPPPAA